MEPRLKQRLVGGVVLVALAVIFIPELFESEPLQRDPSDIPIEIPPKPVVSVPTPAPAGQEAAAPALSPSRPLPPAPAAESAEPQEAAAPPEQAPVIALDEPASDTAGTPRELATWAVQVGSFGSEANARALADKLRQKGYTAYVDATRADGKAFYRVRVGPIIQRQEADALQARLASKEALKGLVVPHP